MDQNVILTIIGVTLLVIVGYFLVMRVFFRESKALDKNIDLAKMKKWKDED